MGGATFRNESGKSSGYWRLGLTVSVLVFVGQLHGNALAMGELGVGRVAGSMGKHPSEQVSSYVGKWLSEEGLEEIGWHLVVQQSRGDVNAETWDNGYVVYEKDGQYGVLITRMEQVSSISGKRPMIGPRNRPRVVGAATIKDIPKGYVATLTCIRRSDERKLEAKCRASRPEDQGANCSLGKSVEEVLAFVKLPQRCSQEAVALKHIYRYDDRNHTMALWAPVEELICNVEDTRPADCPQLLD